MKYGACSYFKTFQGTLATGEDILVREEVILSLIGASNVQDNVHKLSIPANFGQVSDNKCFGEIANLGVVR